ncbi:protein kinase domain-containing protein [Candidatus Berkiella aquae]|uniref:Protein kinase domain protein n=1 Tax=Candidatus Berkiella aquae TaxID=295108 RepID=A0A0Q9Z2D8_9GAMM|nr:serine/threonine-protein kinase [Candidatus Berkiella aquae]MCS5711911.1 serine/threonine-protein kinase [Candidatus Berkiella aquae]
MVFKLTEQDWQQAEAFLTGKPSGTKFEKAIRNPQTGNKIPHLTARHHSFVIIDEIIYAISNRRDTEPALGSNAIVKKGQTRAGEVVALKIEFGPLKNENADDYQIARKDGLIISQGLRTGNLMTITVGSKQGVPFQSSVPKVLAGYQKRYTVMQWRGDTIFDLIENERFPLKTRYLLALKSCLRVRELHQDGALHCDLKAENLAATIENDKVIIKLLDTDFAKNMPSNSQGVIGVKPQGTPGFVSPEILLKNYYSKLSDTYALAVMCLFQLDITDQAVDDLYDLYQDDSIDAIQEGKCFDVMSWLERYQLVIDPKLHEILKDILAFDVRIRKDTDDLILYLCEQLKSDPTINQDLLSGIAEIELSVRIQKIILQESVVQKVENVATATVLTYQHPCVTKQRVERKCDSASPRMMRKKQM